MRSAREEESRPGTVLVTGASSGIGRATALALDANGWRVFAGVRRTEDAGALKEAASPELRCVILDVTDERSIEAAVRDIDEGGGRLDALVNNAGIGRGGPLESIPVPEMRAVYDVNVIGLMAVTRACLPLLRRSGGRIVNIGSTASFLAGPGAAVYAGSKFAVRALTDALRTELRPFGIRVMLVAPGAVESRIWEKGAAFKQRAAAETPAEVREAYRPLYAYGEALRASLKRLPADAVAAVLTEALLHPNPKSYYIVGNDAIGAARAARLPRRLLDRIIEKRMRSFA